MLSQPCINKFREINFTKNFREYDFTKKALVFLFKKKNYMQNREDVKVLLLPISSGANGLNLIEASHVLLMEPILNPAQELQAIGRVHRIGQNKPTTVHRFLIRFE